MSRRHTFFEKEFEDEEYDPQDQGEFELGLVFIIMPFQEEVRDVYSAIKDECNKLHLNAIRVDENIGSGLIIKDIIKLIEQAEFIICDLSYERPNVYYELGYAHGVGNESMEILLIAKENTKLHFDVAPFRVQYYSSTEHLRKIVSSNLGYMLNISRKNV